MMECRRFAHLVGAYLDGQLEAASLLELEEHLPSCAACRERVTFERAVRASLKRAAKADVAPDALRARVLAMCAAQKEAAVTPISTSIGAGESARDAERAQAAAAPPEEVVGWRTMVPLAVAASLAMMWGTLGKAPRQQAEVLKAGIDDPLVDLAAEHARPLPSEFRDPKDVSAAEQIVGVPLQPMRLEKVGARLLGGRFVPLHQERAAVLRYEISSGSNMHRVSVYVFDPRKIQVRAADFTPRAVGTAEVRVGQVGGYTWAIRERDSVAYAVASDLDADGVARLVADE